MARGRKRKCSNPLNAICHMCGKEKSLDEFHANRARSNGKSSLCKVCIKIYSNEREANPKKNNICIKCGKPTHRKLYCSLKCFHARYLSISPDRITLKKCPKCNQIKPLNADNYYRSKNTSYGFSVYCKLCSSKQHREWAASDRGKASRSKNRKIYSKSDTHKRYIKKMLPARRANEAIRRKTDLRFVLSNRMRCLMYQALRGEKNGRKWEDLSGYSADALHRRLEKIMPAGYTWQDVMDRKLEMDHIIPISAFNFTKPEHIDFKKCWALSNLQLLTGRENRRKYNKLDKPFQPSLLIE